MHKTRSNRKANAKRREALSLKFAPLSKEEIDKRTAANAAAKLERYPHPPKYRYEMSGALPDQPACYTVWFDPLVRHARV